MKKIVKCILKGGQNVFNTVPVNKTVTTFATTGSGSKATGVTICRGEGTTSVRCMLWI